MNYFRSRRCRLPVLVSFFISNFWSMPSYACGAPVNYSYEAEILSFEELRKDIDYLGPKNIATNGKILLYKHYLLINEPDLGIHIFDNADPANPVALGFLPILGTTDFSIKDDILYADSYVDLLTFDVSSMEDISLRYRLEDTFEPRYNPNRYDVDPEAGVILSVTVVYN